VKMQSKMATAAMKASTKKCSRSPIYPVEKGSSRVETADPPSSVRRILPPGGLRRSREHTPEGRADVHVAHQSVWVLQPRLLVIIDRHKSNALMLADALCTPSSGEGGKNNGTSPLAHIPVDGEKVELTVSHTAYGVRLLDTPYLTRWDGNDGTPRSGASAKIGDCSVSLVDLVATGNSGWWMGHSSLSLVHRKAL